jgi:hypothetical protein
MTHWVTIILCGLMGQTALAALAPAEPVNLKAEVAQLTLWATARTPDQMAAFYEGRGFPAPMIDILKKSCFITAAVRNKTNDILWLDLADWRFDGPAGPLIRVPRGEWLARWTAMGMPASAQSTFRWTLLPELIALQPDESQGGNITLPRIPGTFSLTARFATGQDRQGPPVVVHLENLQCADDASP